MQTVFRDQKTKDFFFCGIPDDTIKRENVERGNKMQPIVFLVNQYLTFCQYQKLLSAHSIRAYRVDMGQLIAYLSTISPQPMKINELDKGIIQGYIQQLMGKYNPRTCKRKIATLKAFLNHLEFEDIIALNPMRKINTTFKEPKLLPKHLKLNEMESLLQYMYSLLQHVTSPYARYKVLRCIAYLELLFATGIRVGELCALTLSSINIEQGLIKVYGKGKKERIVYIGSQSVLTALSLYLQLRLQQETSSKYFFLSWTGEKMREESVRSNLRRCAFAALAGKHVTPHMIRHTFATLLLEEGVDIKFIQEFLGHSSVVTTQKYLHLTNLAHKTVLETKHPRIKLGNLSSYAS